jgi:hypothetical protein
MGRAFPRLTAAAVLAAAVVALSGTAVASGMYTSCHGGFDPDGQFRQSGVFYRGIRVRGIKCSKGRMVVHAYTLRLNGVAGSLDGKTVQIDGFSCKTVSTSTADVATCSESRGRRVKFFGSP